MAFCTESDCEKLFKSFLVDGKDINACNSRGKTALMSASQQGNVTAVESLIATGANILARDCKGKTAAMFSCEAGHRKILQIFLEKGNVALNYIDNHGKTMLMYSCEQGHLDLVQLLIEHGADVNVCNNDGKTSLIYASLRGHETIVDLLLKHGADMEAGYKNQTAFMKACENGHEKVAELLLTAGAVTYKVGRNKKTALMYACNRGNIKLVELLLQCEKNIDQMDKEWKNALMYSALNGHKDILGLLVKHGANVNELDERFGQTALICACKNNKTATMMSLIRYGANVNQRLQNKQLDGAGRYYTYEKDKNKDDKRGGLIKACKRGHVNAARLLIENGADTDSLNGAFVYAFRHHHSKIIRLFLEKGIYCNLNLMLEKIPHLKDCLLSACYKGKKRFIEFVTDNGIDWNFTNADMQNPLHKACMGGHYELVKFFKNLALDVPYCSDCGLKTPIIHAVRKENIDLVTLLLEGGDSAEVSDLSGETPLMLICKISCFSKKMSGELTDLRVSIAKTLIQYGADLHAEDRKRKTVLMYACEAGLKPLVETILKHGINVNARDESGKTAFMLACRKGRKEIIELLLNHGIDVNVVDKSGYNALNLALGSVTADTLKLLLDYGALDTDPHNKHGKALLWMATECKSFDQIKLLYLRGADISITNDRGETLLMLACYRTYLDVAEYLIEIGLNVNQKDSLGKTCLMHALSGNMHRGVGHLVELLLKSGADVKSVATGDRGRTPLMYACQSSFPSNIVELFLRFGANVNQLDYDGNTALIYACDKFYREQPEKVEVLLKYHAHVNIQNKDGMTALMYAAQNIAGWESMRLLLDAGAEVETKCSLGVTVVFYALFGTRKYGSGMNILLNTGRMTSNGRLKPIHRVCKSIESVHHLLAAVKLGIFEWEMCRQCNFMRFLSHALKAGLCPGRIDHEDRNTSPLIAVLDAFYSSRNSIKLLGPILDNLYFYLEDYNTLLDNRDKYQKLEKHLNSILAQPLKLSAWCFLTVSKAISLSGSPCRRKLRVEQLPLPPSLKRKLCFTYKV